IANGRLLWRYFSSAALERKPEATDRDVFVSAGRNTLTRLERDTGREMWTNRVAQRFLSTDFKYVWAVDRIGQLHVLDYQRGTTLAKYDTSEYVVPVSNDLTDRFLFAANDGQVLCLRHRDHREPVRTKTPPRIVERKEETKEPVKEPEKKVEDKEKEKEKEKEKVREEKKE